MRLSACLIVKNEAAYLKDCLHSIQALADEIIVVDTGSEDDTLHVAQTLGAQILIPLYQWKGAPNVEVKMPNNPKTYRWAGQNFGNVSRLYQTAPVSSIRTQNTAQIKANFKPVYVTQKDLSLGDLCQEAKSIMSQYGS